ncbi:hypothetical protein B0H15DRAFT_542712 [Mycena belliarum]|uniref:Novel STAND NTPase 1 domain-containing protein n=1 Tax=Mycena belliarum TaxID=1033014 RepID=A0AAD6UDQ4_9AGAR|nr:hypothetical protein B0H15DRAFT_542712 [Mycena belliae]
MHRGASKVDNVLHYLKTAAGLLRDIAEGTDLSYLRPVAGISLLILDTVYVVKTNRDQCLVMVEHIYEIICVIINVCEAGTGLSSATLRNISTFIRTLQKVHSVIRSQLEHGLVKRLVRHAENLQQLDECKAALKHSMGLFGIQHNIWAASVTIAEMHAATLKHHQELLEYLTDSSQCDSRISIEGSLHSFQTGSSTSSFLLLPGSPKIFHGRDTELTQILTGLLQPEAVCVAVLGPGGIGKSTLSLAVLHDTDIISKFGSNRHFIACDAASSAVELVSLLGSFFGLKQQANTVKGIVKHLSAITGPVVLVLDNLETSWEPRESRAAVEDLLSTLADIKQLSLIVTMRGIERPAKIRWTRPFLAPLRPLSDAAARQTFVDIADEVDDEQQLREILSFCSNLPLAVSLMANMVSYEGFTEVIRRWETQKTSLLSEGAGKDSSLDKSIALSLTSQRMSSHPDALQLLSLLSVLPDGLSDQVIKQLQFSRVFENILGSKSTLLRTSLAYIDFDQRLKVLAPIREYVRHLHPPTSALVTPLLEYYFDLVRLFEGYHELPSGDLFRRISTDFGNITSMLQTGLQSENPRSTREAAIGCAISLATFTRTMVRGSNELFRSMTGLVETFGDKTLLGRYLLELSLVPDKSISTLSVLKQANECFETVGDLGGLALVYERLSWYYAGITKSAKAVEYDTLAFETAEKAGDGRLRAKIYYTRARLQHLIGTYEAGIEFGRQCVDLSQDVGSIYYEAQGNSVQSRCYARMGDYGPAVRHSDRALTLIEALGLERNSTVGRDMLNAHAEILLQKTEYSKTREIYRMMETWESSGGFGQVQRAFTLVNLVVIDCAMGNFTGSQELIDSARSILASAYDAGQMLAVCDLTQGDLELGQMHLDAAEGFYNRAFAYYRGEHPEMTIWALQKLGDVALARRDLVAALPRVVTHLAFAHKTRNWKEVSGALQRIGDVFVGEGDDTTACGLFTVALDSCTAMDIHQPRAECMLRIGDIRKRGGNLIEARDWWVRARPLFEKSSQASGGGGGGGKLY